VEGFGPESSGKTTIALQVIAEAQRNGGSAAFIDAEHALDPGYARKLGVDVDNLLVSQPGPGSRGTTEVVPETTVTAKDAPTRNVVLKQGATVEELVRALTAIGSSARDIIAILQNLRAAGALDADLEVI